jgi:tRNA(Ile)-lysidine synthase TilS/MesJ
LTAEFPIPGAIATESSIPEIILEHHMSLIKFKKTNYSYSLIQNYSSTFELTRPLLKIHRSDTFQIIKENNLPLCIDQTNKSFKLTRNKIRLLLLPLVRYYIHAKTDFQLKKYLTTTFYEQDFLYCQSHEFLELFCNYPENIRLVVSLPVSIQTLFLQNVLSKYSSKQIKTSLTIKIQEFIELKNGSPGTRTRN